MTEKTQGFSDERPEHGCADALGLKRREETEKNDAGISNAARIDADVAEYSVCWRRGNAVASRETVAPSESAASEELEPGQWLYENLGGEWRQADARLRGKYAHIERACIERGRAEARESFALAVEQYQSIIKFNTEQCEAMATQRDEYRDQLAAKDREIAKLRSRLERSEQSRLDTKAKLDAVARALHPHWPADGRNSYIANRLPGMIRLLREPNVVLKQKLVAAEREIAEPRERIQTCITERDAKISELFDQTVEQRMQLEALEKSYRVVLTARPTPVEGNALQGYAFIDNKHPINVAQGESHGNRRDVTGTHIDQHRDSRPDGGETSSRGADQGSECGPEVAHPISGHHEAGGSEHVGLRGAQARVTQHSGPAAGATCARDSEGSGVQPEKTSTPAVGSGSDMTPAKPIQTSPFPSVARESAKAWRTQAEPFFPEREAAGKAATALRDEVRGWLGDVKPSEAILSKSMVNGYPIVPAERFAAIEWFLDEIWARAQGSK